MPYYNLQEELEEGRINIDPTDNICNVCGKPFKHFKRYYLENEMTMKQGIKCVDIITAHAGCRSLLSKIQKLKDEIIELEFELYCKRI
jgi:hypothetical protein